MKKKIIIGLLLVAIIAVAIIPIVSAAVDVKVVSINFTSSATRKYSSSTSRVNSTATYDCTNSILSTGYACAQAQYALAGQSFRDCSSLPLVVNPSKTETLVISTGGMIPCSNVYSGTKPVS